MTYKMTAGMLPRYTYYEPFKLVEQYDTYEFPYDLSDFTYTHGYGKLTAGHLDIAKGAKSFGTFGQLNYKDWSVPKYPKTPKRLGIVDNWSSPCAATNCTAENYSRLSVSIMADTTGTTSFTESAQF